MDMFWQDLKYALRSLRKAPGFTATAVLTLGLGLGASVAVFSVVNAVYFSRLPYPNADHLLIVETPRAANLCRPLCPTFVDVRELREWSSQLSTAEVAGLQATQSVVSTPAGLEMTMPAVVTANFFPLLGLRPELGRVFVPTDDQVGAENVVVLSHRFWRDRF